MKITQTHLQNIKIAICGILVLLLLFLTVLELFTQEKTDLTVKESLTVSASITDTASGTYENLIKGVLFNDSEKAITVEALTVTVKNANGEKKISYDQPIVLPARAEKELTISTLDATAYTSVENITATLNGAEQALSNAPQRTVSVIALILIALILVMAYLLYRTILTRYYMHLESKLKTDTEQ